MEWAIWAGAGLTLLGVIGLVWCIWLAMKVRKAGLSEDEIRAKLQAVVALNVGALGLSGLGLMLVVFGVILS